MKELCKGRQMEDALGTLSESKYMELCSSILQECLKKKELAEGKRIHAKLMKCPSNPSPFTWNTLIHMYIKCDSLTSACKAFNNLRCRNVFIWTTMIGGYASSQDGREALRLFGQMKHVGVKPDRVTFITVLGACTNTESLHFGKFIHAVLLENGLCVDLIAGNTLIDMYAKCGSMRNAWQVFHNLPQRDVVSWNALIVGYVQHSYFDEILQFYWQMWLEGVKPDKITIMGHLNACSALEAAEQGKWLHGFVLTTELCSDVFIGNTVIDMYAKCSRLNDAYKVFKVLPTKDVVSWSVMITAYVQHEKGERAITLFRQMRIENVKPDSIIFLSILGACASLRSIEMGKHMHAHILQTGFVRDAVLGSALVDMYAKCGSLETAQKVFSKLHTRDIVSWSAIIAGYAHNGDGLGALELLSYMHLDALYPDKVLYISVLGACTVGVALGLGKQIHAGILKAGYGSDAFVCSALIDMYFKCGYVEFVVDVFDNLPMRDLVAWNSMIAGFAQHGDAHEAHIFFWRMQLENVNVDEVTFTSVLSACSHAGWVNEGCFYFTSISQCCMVTPTVQHYGCLIDLLGRVGCLVEAEDLVDTMPLKPNLEMWMSFVGGCILEQ